MIKICVSTFNMTSRIYFGKMNSTLGSVVPLGMFLICKGQSKHKIRTFFRWLNLSKFTRFLGGPNRPKICVGRTKPDFKDRATWGLLGQYFGYYLRKTWALHGENFGTTWAILWQYFFIFGTTRTIIGRSF